MRVPVSLLRQLSPVKDDRGPVPVRTIAAVMNDRVSEVEKVHAFPSRTHFAAWSLQPGEDGLLTVVDTDGRAATELDLGIGDDNSHPVTVGPDVAAGADLFDVFDCDDAVIEFDLEPNRPDLYSLVGMARDAAAIWGSGMHLPECTDRVWPDSSDVEIVSVTEKVPRYVAVEVVGVDVGPSPQWLQNAVRKLGMRPINNVVDATNLVMMELGEPMHTFDRRQIGTGVIGLRLARDGEKMTTLDGVERTLTHECLLVVDGDPTDGGGTPVALAGVMGSAGSSVTTETTGLLIEAASFDMASVRRASRRLSLRTEASLRFEKGLPQSGVGLAVDRLVHLLTQVGGPDVEVVGRADHWPAPPEAVEVLLDPDRVRQRLAMELSDDRIDQILGMAGCIVERRARGGAPPGHWRVQRPDYRPDLSIPEDLEEEVGRIHGYDHVDATLPAARLRPVTPNPVFRQASRARDVLLSWGLDEVYLSTWVSDDELQTFQLPAPGEGSALVELQNPLNVELRYFRPSALPAVLAAVRENRKLMPTFGLFEIGRVYQRDEHGIISEPASLAGAVNDPASQDAGGAVFRVRDMLLDLCATLGVQVTQSRPNGALAAWAGGPLLHPSRAGVLHAADGTLVASFGQLHPGIAKAADLRDTPAVFAANLAALYARASAGTRRFTPPPRFPSVEVHVNVVAPDRMEAALLLDRISAGADSAPDLVARDVRDVWTGKGVPDGHRRLTLALQFNHAERSLTHAEVSEQVQSVASQLAGDTRLQVELPA